MAYMNADTKPKVGFRPYLQTNPRRAALLSGYHNIHGLGDLGQNHPFDPWRLHGLGQWRPFDQDPGGWHLHGLAGLGIDTSGPTDPLTGALWSDEGYAVDGSGNVVVDTNGNPVLASDLAAALAQAAAAAPGPAATPASGGSQPAPQIPSNTPLIYIASWSNLSVLSESGVIGKMTAALPQYGMSVDSSTPVGNQILTSLGIGQTSIQLNITDHVGHALKSDAQSVLDSLMQQFVGNTLSGTTLSITAATGTPVPATAVAPPAPAATAALTWLEGNWSYLAIAAGLLIVAGPISKGMFGGRRR